MSQTTREVVFSARDNGVGDMMSRLNRSAQELGRDLVRESMESTSSAQEAVKYYEQQVRLIEKKSKLEQKSQRAQIQKRYNSLSGQSGVDQDQLKQDYKDKLTQLQQGSREDQIQVELLRELIDTVKITSAQQVDSTEDSTRQTQSAERSKLNEAGSEFTQLSDQVAQEKSQVTTKKGSVSTNLSQAMRRVASQQDSVGAINEVLEQSNDIPFVGAITGIIGTMAASLAVRVKREQAASTLATLKNTSVDSILDQNIGETQFGGYGPGTLGISREEFMESVAPSTARAIGTTQGLTTRSLQGVEIQKAMGVDGQSVQTLQRLTRVMEGVETAQSLSTKLYSSVYGTGVLGKDNKDFSRMQEIMQQFASFQEGQFMRSGSTSNQGTLSLLRSLQQLGGNFRRDDYTFDTMQRINSGLSSGGSPEANAIKMDILRRQNPNKTFFELQTEMEKGIGSEGYLGGVLEYVKSTGGNLNSQSILFDQLTQGQVRGGDITKILSGQLSLDEVTSKQLNYRQRAEQASSPAQEQMLNFAEQFKDVMSPIGEGVETLIERVETLITYIK